MFAPCNKSYDKHRQHIKKERHHFADKGAYSQSYAFSSSHIQIWELDHKEGWALKNWCFWTVVLGKTLESPLDWKEIKPVNSKGNQPWIFTEMTMLKLRLQYFGHLMWGDDSLKRPWCWERLRAGGEGGSRGWDGWSSRQPTPVFLPGEPHGQRSLVGYSPWGCKRIRQDLATKQQQQ